MSKPRIRVPSRPGVRGYKFLVIKDFGRPYGPDILWVDERSPLTPQEVGAEVQRFLAGAGECSA